MIPETSQTLKISRCIYTSGVMSTIKPDESQQSWLTKKKKALLRKYWKMLCCHLSGSDLAICSLTCCSVITPLKVAHVLTAYQRLIHCSVLEQA